MGNNYQAWMDYESKWIAGYRKKLMRTTTHITIPIVLVFLTLFMGAVGFVDRMSPEDAFYGAVGGFFCGAVVCGVIYLCLRFGLRSGKYRKLVRQAVETAGIPEGEWEQLGAEMLAARDDPGQRIFFEMVGFGSNHTPARFVLTPHYACLIGGYPYAILVRLADLREIRPGEERKVAVGRGAQTRGVHTFTLHTIGYYRRDRADRDLGPGDLPDESMGFFSEEIRDKALAMLREGTGIVRTGAD